MELEREKGITIKSQTACFEYQSKSKKSYLFNLIDTPGHVDFSYEVSRALAACEAVLLVIDASQGVQAQTFANMYQALEHDLEIIPVINKIDLPTADIQKVKLQIEEDLGLDSQKSISISAKEGIGIHEVLEKIIEYCPYPKGNIDYPAKALIFDAYFDFYKGVVISVRIIDGVFQIKDTIYFMETKKTCKIEELGIYRLEKISQKSLSVGEVGYISGNIKNLSDIKIGDTITLLDRRCHESLPGYQDVQPVVFAGIYPVDSGDYEDLKKSIGKLKLNDGSLTYEAESSNALGFGYRCGFLGLLHMEIVQERFRREFNLDLITTSPSVKYKVDYTNGETKIIENPSYFPEKNEIKRMEELYVKVEIICPEKYLGGVLNICHDKRGIQKGMNYLDKNRIEIDFELPLGEVIYDFHDKIKSISGGYASYHYEILDYRSTELVRVDILVNGKKVDALSQVMHKARAVLKGRTIIEKLKEVIPRHLFQVPIQAAIGGKVIARENIRALKKDVTAKCYGGDISRKRKLLERQKEGKKKMKSIGNVEIPQEAFLSILKITS